MISQDVMDIVTTLNSLQGALVDLENDKVFVNEPYLAVVHVSPVHHLLLLPHLSYCVECDVICLLSQ